MWVETLSDGGADQALVDYEASMLHTSLVSEGGMASNSVEGILHLLKLRACHVHILHGRGNVRVPSRIFDHYGGLTRLSQRYTEPMTEWMKGGLLPNPLLRGLFKPLETLPWNHLVFGPALKNIVMLLYLPFSSLTLGGQW